MGVTCPRCGHERTTQEDVSFPEWKCPKCDVVYAKVREPEEKGASNQRRNGKIADKRKIRFVSAKKVIPVLAAIAIIALGFFGYRLYARSAYVDTISPALQRATLYTSNIVDDLISPNDITYRELLKKTETSLAELDKNLIEIEATREIAWKEIYEFSTEYIESSQKTIRAIDKLLRKRLAMNAVAKDALVITQTKVTASNAAFLGGAARDASAKIAKSKTEVDEAIEALNASAQELANILWSSPSGIPRSILLDVDKFNQIKLAYLD